MTGAWKHRPPRPKPIRATSIMQTIPLGLEGNAQCSIRFPFREDGLVGVGEALYPCWRGEERDGTARSCASSVSWTSGDDTRGVGLRGLHHAAICGTAGITKRVGGSQPARFAAITADSE